MNRREFLARALAAGSALPLAGCDDHGAAAMPRPLAPSRGPDGKMRIPWQNWSGYQHCLPGARLTPETDDEMAGLLRYAPGPVRPAGAGHSFSPLVSTDGGTLVSLRNFEGLIAHDPKALTATLGAGTRLRQVGELLQGIGQALPNLPDIDEQTLAGALATGTHGSGETLGALHASVVGLRLATPGGELIDCSRSRHADLFHAARVSLGSLGVITRITLQNLPTQRLRRRAWMEPVESLLDRFDALAAQHRSFELYLLPFCDRAVAISIDPTDDEMPRKRTADRDNAGLMELKNLRDWCAHFPRLRRYLLNRATHEYPPQDAVDSWERIYPSDRTVRFNEMEYHLPREQLIPALRQVRERIESHHPEEFFPVEVRVTRGDDAWLSPFHGGAAFGSIAVHRYHLEDPLPYFADIEALFQPLGGRPHWGKMHTLGAAALAPRYPRWKDFLALRESLDPGAKMLNPHLKAVFGVD